MKIYSEMSLRDFEPWSGAVSSYNRVRDFGKLDDLEAIFEDLYPDGMSETEINDLFRFEPESVYEWVGIPSEEEEEEAEREQEEAEEADTFTDYCGAFSDCAHCPLNEIPGKCESIWAERYHKKQEAEREAAEA